MEIPLQITSRDFELTDAIKSEITEKAEKLDKFYDRIMRCRIVVETPHRHKHEGKLYNVQIHLTIPGREIIVKREPHEDLYVAIRNSFDAAKRKLEDASRLLRGKVKFHEEQPHARISSIFPEMSYGFIKTPDNREIYFHENSVVNQDFSKLKVGMEVRFTETKGEKGPQASSLTII
ncbi:MAG: ribosome-associated translation inhibitor RaiA [Nitrospiraceae bacterium]|nr:MAG: ribosome-associated translation inhibitor RaiA [Nitrospiraceae bacterium]